MLPHLPPTVITTSLSTLPANTRNGCFNYRYQRVARACRSLVPAPKSATHEHPPSAHQQWPKPTALPHYCDCRVRVLCTTRLFCLRDAKCKSSRILCSPPTSARANACSQTAKPTETLSTPLYTHGGTLDFATRLSKVLARKTGKPVYVGSSSSFASAGMGGIVEEEMEGFRRVVEVVMGLLKTDKE